MKRLEKTTDAARGLVAVLALTGGLYAAGFDVTVTRDDGSDGTLSAALVKAAETPGNDVVTLRVLVTPSGADYSVPAGVRLDLNGNFIEGVFTMRSADPSDKRVVAGTTTTQFVKFFRAIQSGDFLPNDAAPKPRAKALDFKAMLKLPVPEVGTVETEEVELSSK